MFDPNLSKVLPPRIQRLAWRLHQYNFHIQHIAGNANTPDSLLHLPSKQNDPSDTGFVCENYVFSLQYNHVRSSGCLSF